MGRLIALLFFADLALLVVALIDSLSTDRHEVRKLPKAIWVLFVLLISPIGPILWFVYGRPKKVAVAAGAAPRRGRRPVAPDDDPEFLRKLNPPPQRNMSVNDEDLLRRFEEDLRRRDEEPPEG
jgi:Phospholipase_D-nuclease N-terminal